MSEIKYTPGPWSINQWTQPDREISIGAVGTPLIARVMLRDVSINEHKANARLIEQAPLQILESIKEDIRDKFDSDPLMMRVVNMVITEYKLRSEQLGKDVAATDTKKDN